MSWICLLFILTPVYAQLEAELDVIQVEATKDIERFTFSKSHSILPEKLENQTLGLISPELENVPGLIANQNGGPGGRISFFLRGTESRHLSFVMDGLKINDTSNVDRQFDSAFVTAPFVREMFIYKGPQAVLYGSDAMGGLVEIITRKGENAPETRVNVSGGSFGTIASSISKDWSSKTSNGTLTASRFHSDGISRLNKKRFNAKEKDATDITQLTSSSEHQLWAKAQTDLLFSYNHGKAEQDGFQDDNSFDYSRNDQYILQQKTNYELTEKSAISLRNGFNRHQRKNVSLSEGNEFFNGDLLQHDAIYRLDLNPIDILSGIATEHEGAKTIELDRSFDLHSAFLQTSYSKELFKAQAGMRADRHSKYGSFYTGSAGLSYSEMSLQYSQGYKAPSLYQLYGPDMGGQPVGNPNLHPETNHSLELSWIKKNEKFETEISFFQNRLSNLFTYIYGKGYINQQRFISEGAEFSGKWKERLLEFSGSWTHQEFKKEEDPVLRRPGSSVRLGASYFPMESIECNLTTRWFSKRKDFGRVGYVKLNDYEVVDLAVRKNWKDDSLGVELKNLMNREYEDLYGFSVVPRSIFASYGHRF